MAPFATVQVLQVFLASPGDVQDERRVAWEVVSEVNQVVREIGWEVRLLGWEDTLPGYGRPQEIINTDVDKCHLFVGVLWKRWGHSTGKHSSGFQEEYERAKKRRMEGPLPEIWIFFKHVEDTSDPGKQLQRVLAFRQEQETQGLFKEFCAPEEFRTMLRDYLLRYVITHQNEEKPSESPSDISTPASMNTDSPVRPTDVAHQSPEQDQIIHAITELRSLVKESAMAVENMDSFETVRLYLHLATLMSERYTTEVLSVHDTNALYLHRERLAATALERKHLTRSLVHDSHDVVPGWYWVRDADPERLGLMLSHLATGDSNNEVRREAFRLMKELRLPPPTSTTMTHHLHTATARDSDELKVAALQYIGEVGQSTDLSVLELFADNNSSTVRDESTKARLRILATMDFEQALNEIDSVNTRVPSELEAEISARANTIGSQHLIQWLRHANPRLREISVQELSKRGELPPDQVPELKKDVSTPVRAACFRALITSGTAVDVSEIKNAFPNQVLLDYGVADAIILDLCRSLDFDDLIHRLNWYSLDSHLVYRALAEKHFDRVGTLVRSDLQEGFIRLADAAAENLRSLFGAPAEEVIAGWNGPKGFLQAQYSVAALEGLALNGDRSDAPLARTCLLTSCQYLQEEQWLAAIRILARVGDESDTELLVRVAGESRYTSLKRMATSAAVSLTSGDLTVIRHLIASCDSAVITTVLEQTHPTPELLDLAQELLANDVDEVRRAAVAFMVRNSSPEELGQVLTAYTSRTKYYYNVVCWLDRVLYAPAPAKDYYRSKLLHS